MEVKPGYKQTEAGVIPEEWGVEKLKECCSRLTVGFVGTCEPFYTRATDGVLLLRTGNLQGDKIALSDVKYVTKSFHAANKKSKVNRGDILIARHGNFGSAVLVPASIDDVNALNIVIIRTDEKLLLARFAAYCINSDAVRGQALGKAAGSTQVVINTGEIAELMLPLPPLPEQCTIAGALSDVDALIGALNQLIAKKRDLKQAAMQQLLTGQKRLPGFDLDWDVKRLGDVAEIVMGQSPSSSNYNAKGIGLPLIQGNADIANRKTIKRIFTTEITKRGKCGDILMSVRAPVGEISRAVFDVCLGRGVCAIRCDNDFIYHYLISKEPSWANLSKGSTFDSVNSADVKALAIHLPIDANEQSAIFEVLSDMDAELAALEQRRDKIRALKQAMMQELLTGKTRLV